MLFNVRASVGNRNGVFDAAYSFGNGVGSEGRMRGSPEEIGAEVARYLTNLTPEDCKAMQYGTGRFFVELRIEPQWLRKAAKS
jgi:hypothetical protein